MFSDCCSFGNLNHLYFNDLLTDLSNYLFSSDNVIFLILFIITLIFFVKSSIKYRHFDIKP